MRILIADDDRVLVHQLSMLLRARGADVATAYDAFQAWSLALRSQVDAVILDIQMPGGTGIEVLKKLRNSAKTASLPVVVLTGSVDKQMATKMKELGADEFLTKPVEFPTLYEVLARLTAKSATTAPEGLRRAHESALRQGPVSEPKRRILVAEDDPTARHLLEALLAKWGYEVLVVQDGHEAWEVMQGRDAPRLAILDWMMPGIDGVSLCRRIRARAVGTYTYILLLTAKDSKAQIVEALDAGADDYLTKPFDSDELAARLRAGWRLLQHGELASKVGS